MKKLSLLLVFVLCAATAFSAYEPMEKAQGLTITKAAQAPVDQAFFGLTDVRNLLDPYYKNGVRPDSASHIAIANKEGVVENAEDRRNSTYAWGVTEVGNEIWYGVMNNAWCGWMVSHLRLAGTDGMNFLTDHQACGGKAAGTQLYIYNVDTNKITTIDADNFKNQTLADDYRRYFNDTTDAGPRVRAAGNLNGVVFFAGQYSDNQGTPDQMDFEIMFAFDAETKEYLGSARLPYNSTRRISVLTDSQGNKGLYTFFGGDTTTAGLGECRSTMYRWVGTRENPLKGGTKFNEKYEIDPTGDIETGWELVYTFDIRIGAPGEFVQFRDKDGKERVIVTTWATDPKTIEWWWEGVEAGKWENEGYETKPETKAGTMLMSSPIPEGGFTGTNNPTFTEMFVMDEYEPDEHVAKGYELGAMHVFGDYLIWGTMHVGLSAGYKRYIEAGIAGLDEYDYTLMPGMELCGEVPTATCVPPAYAAYVAIAATLKSTYNEAFAAEALRKTWRAMHIFSTKLDFNAADAVSMEALKAKTLTNTELLYGEKEYEVYNKATSAWEVKPNIPNWTPKYGPMGLGNILNVYTWTMHLYNNKLYIGTFDLIGGMDDFTKNAWEKKDRHHPNPLMFEKDGVTPKYNSVKPSMLQMLDYTNEVNNNPKKGADLFVMDTPTSPAKLVTDDGFGNEWNNGVRNASVVNGRFFVGTSTYSVLSKDGGLEFYEISDGSSKGDSDSSGGCSVGAGSDYVLFALLIGCIGVVAIRRIRKA